MSGSGNNSGVDVEERASDIFSQQNVPRGLDSKSVILFLINGFCIDRKANSI